MLLARLLSPHDYGVAGMVLVASSLVLIFADLAFGYALVQKEELTEADRSTVFWTNVSAGLLFTLGGIALSGPIADFYRDPSVQPLFAVFSLTFFVTALSSTHIALLSREMNFKTLELRQMLSYAAGAVVGIAVAAKGGGAWAIIFQQLTIAVASTVLLVVLAPWRPKFMYSIASLRSMAGFSGRLFGSRILFYFNRNIDNILVESLSGLRARHLLARLQRDAAAVQLDRGRSKCCTRRSAHPGGRTHRPRLAAGEPRRRCDLDPRAPRADRRRAHFVPHAARRPLTQRFPSCRSSARSSLLQSLQRELEHPRGDHDPRSRSCGTRDRAGERRRLRRQLALGCRRRAAGYPSRARSSGRTNLDTLRAVEMRVSTSPESARRGRASVGVVAAVIAVQLGRIEAGFPPAARLAPASWSARSSTPRLPGARRAPWGLTACAASSAGLECHGEVAVRTVSGCTSCRAVLAAATIAILASCGGGRMASPPSTRRHRPGRVPVAVLPDAAAGFRPPRPARPPVRLSAQRGHVVLLAFLYTRCRDVCPLTQIISRPRRRRRLRWKVTSSRSADPAGDTPGAVRRFIRVHRLGAGFSYLTGTRAELQPVWQAYNVLAIRRNDEVVDHSAPTLLLDARGRPRVYYEPTSPAARSRKTCGALAG